MLKPDGHFVLVSHLGPDSDEGMDLLQDAILRGLKQGSCIQQTSCNSTAAAAVAADEQEYLWTVGVHCAAQEDDDAADSD